MSKIIQEINGKFIPLKSRTKIKAVKELIENLGNGYEEWINGEIESVKLKLGNQPKSEHDLYSIAKYTVNLNIRNSIKELNYTREKGSKKV